MSDEQSEHTWYQVPPIQPRTTANPQETRCLSCGDGKMYHPAHKWEPCWVPMPGGGACGCTVGVQPPSESYWKV